MGNEVPGAHSYSDERGFSCCIIGLGQMQGRSWIDGGAARGGSLRAGARPTRVVHCCVDGAEVLALLCSPPIPSLSLNRCPGAAKRGEWGIERGGDNDAGGWGAISDERSLTQAEQGPQRPAL